MPEAAEQVSESPSGGGTDWGQVASVLEPERQPREAGDDYRGDHEGLREAAADLNREREKREEHAAPKPEAEDRPPVEIEYLDKAKAPAEVSLRQASKDLGDYRDQQRRQALADLIGDDAQSQQEGQAPEAQAPEAQAPDGAPQQAESTPEQALQAEREIYQQARRNYESSVEQLGQGTWALLAGEFADLATPQDAQRLLISDPARYARFQQLRQTLDAAFEQHQAAHQARQVEAAQAFRQFARQQDHKARELIPELADPAQRGRIQTATLEMLREAGVSDAEARALYRNEARISLRDARVQRVMADAAKWRMAQAAARNAQARPAPPVQRPGVAGPRTSYLDQEVERLNKREFKSPRDAAALLAAQRKARR